MKIQSIASSHRVGIVARSLWVFILACLLSGCVSSRYKEAKKGTPPTQWLDVPSTSGPLQLTLRTVVTYNGPGSWKRDAFWDEYVVSLTNSSNAPLTVSTAALTDSAGGVRSPGTEPWTLEKESKTWEQKYRDAGVAFVRYTTPAVIIVGAGAATVGAVGIFSSAAATVGTVTVVALPVYYLGVVWINHSNRAAMENEFHRRRMMLPLTLAPGESKTGSLFFSVMPSPRSLRLGWTSGVTGGDAVLMLECLRGLHLENTSPPAMAN